jgi:hypothetical protein
MNLLYPRLRASWLPIMLAHALLGAALAGLYGIVHDQITYTISPEYFTRLKFAQFHYADFGLPPRIFVAEIGFLAAWWVGFVAGWFIARITVPTFSWAVALRHSLRGFGIILASALAASCIGYELGLLRGPHADYSAWQRFASERGVMDLPAFVRVAYIHNAGYLGGLIGLVISMIYLRRLKRLAKPDSERNG